MHIRMVGIDHQTADIATREAFSFTQHEAQAFVQSCREEPGIEEAVLLTTCSRTELWTVGEGFPMPLLQRFKDRPLPGDAACREEDEAALHLHRLACGLCSPVAGDEQIITQVRQAQEAAGTACGLVLGQLFRSAVTAGKQARAQAGAPKLPRSVAAQAVQKAEELLGSLAGKRALVVGSGAMGALAAGHLLERGAAVTMTMRKYRRTAPDVPQDVQIVDYDDRYDVIGQCDLTVGATSCPHPVLRAEPLRHAVRGELLLLDIALPRDIEPEAAALPGVTLLDLDHIGGPTMDAEALAAMESIAARYTEDFLNWLQLRETLPSIEAVRGFARRRMQGLQGLTGEQRRDVEARTLEMLDMLLFTVKKREGLAAFQTVSRALGRAAAKEEKGT